MIVVNSFLDGAILLTLGILAPVFHPDSLPHHPRTNDGRQDRWT